MTSEGSFGCPIVNGVNLNVASFVFNIDVFGDTESELVGVIDTFCWGQRVLVDFLAGGTAEDLGLAMRLSGTRDRAFISVGTVFFVPGARVT